MRVGLQFSETMTGHFAPVTGAPPCAMSVMANVASPSLRGALVSGAPMQVTGRVTIAGHVTDATVEGAIELDLWSCRRIVYDLSWRNSEGLYSRFFGQKTLRATHPVESWTTLKGQVHVGGVLSGHATLRFDLRSLPAFLRTMRPLLR